MKKLLFYSISIFLLNIGINAQTSKIDPVYADDFMLADYSSNVVNKKTPGVGFSMEIGRVSRKCRGIGICDLIAFWIVIVKGQAPSITQLDVNVLGENNNYYIIVNLVNDLDETKFNTAFEIEKDFTSSKGELTVKKGVFILDKSIGSYGGYKIPVQIN